MNLPLSFAIAGGRRSARDRHRLAFSLIELLVVIGILAIMMVIAVPVVGSLSGSRTMSANVDALSDLLEYARTEAQARKTYVWVGFKNLPTTDPANSSANHEVAAAAFWSTDGTATATGSAIQPLSRVVRLKGVKLVQGYDGSELSDELQALLDSTKTQFYSGGGDWLKRHWPPEPVTNPAADFNPTGKSLPDVSGVSFSMPASTHTVTFTPQGEALFAGEPTRNDGFVHIIDFGLKKMRGDDPDSGSPDDAALWLYGSTGRLREWRLQ